MKMIRLMPLFLLAVVGASANAFAQSPTLPVALGACLNVRSGGLQSVATSAECNRNEVFVSIPLVVGEGPRGVVGPAGPRGPQGANGATGARGATGPKGTTGAAGSLGEIGPEGAIGPAGAVGVMGIEGAKGDPGPAGLTGPVGYPGPQGARGPDGPVGPAGPQGETVSIGRWTSFSGRRLNALSAGEDVVTCDGGRMPLTAAIQSLDDGEIAGFRFEGATVRFFMRNPGFYSAEYAFTVLCAFVR
jgi:hypothetical protein